LRWFKLEQKERREWDKSREEGAVVEDGDGLGVGWGGGGRGGACASSKHQ